MSEEQYKEAAIRYSNSHPGNDLLQIHAFLSGVDYVRLSTNTGSILAFSPETSTDTDKCEQNPAVES